MPKSASDNADERLHVLVIDDEVAHAETVAEALESVGYSCTVATSGKAGAKALDGGEFDVVLTDLKMGDLDGLAIVRKVKAEQPEAEVVVITGYGDFKSAAAAVAEGAAYYLPKPIDLGELRALVKRSAERVSERRLTRSLQQQLNERFGFEGLIGNSSRMHEALGRLKAVAATSTPVLVLGETGTGKELIAKAIHTNSPRKNKPFVALNCTALNENLLDDELFGHERGAFTGADKVRQGRFEYANGGTLFLDEVGDMPLSLQPKLLRVLENGEIVRIGSNEAIKVNVRLIAATHRDLDAEVKAGKFRQDLYYRLKVVTVTLPPLRERIDDIPLLCERFIQEFNARHGKRVKTISGPVHRAFKNYTWPGNVRELKNTIESMVVLDYDCELGADDMPDQSILTATHALPPAPTTSSGDAMIGRPLWEVERYYIQQALARANGNREEAARVLGIGERTLYRNIQDWKLQDKVKAALEEHKSLEGAAAAMGIKPSLLSQKMKKWGWEV
ncbi:MAG: sigma-54-dependent transcriptional regulator [Gemmataceae bacterium]